MNTYAKTLLWATVIIAIISALHIYANGVNENSVRLLIAATARLSAFVFAVAFGASSIQFLFRDSVSKLAVQYRPHLGLVFGISHTFHLMFLIWLQNAIHPVFTLAKTTSLIGGAMAYGLMYLMMLTTFPSIKVKLKPAYWKVLHLAGGYWIWLIFFRSYMRKAMNQQEGYLLLILLTAVLVFRILRELSKLKRRAAPEI